MLLSCWTSSTSLYHSQTYWSNMQKVINCKLWSMYMCPYLLQHPAIQTLCGDKLFKNKDTTAMFNKFTSQPILFTRSRGEATGSLYSSLHTISNGPNHFAQEVHTFCGVLSLLLHQPLASFRSSYGEAGWRGPLGFQSRHPRCSG